MRRLLGLFLIVMVALTVAVGWLGWRLLEQDRDLSRQRIQERLERTADLASATLTRKLSELDESLAADPARKDVLRVVFTPGNIEAQSAVLVYFPFAQPVEDVDDSVYSGGEAAEFRERNTVKAVDFYRSLSHSSNPSIRAGALLRLARNLLKTGDTSAALAVYSDLVKIPNVYVEGIPADLVARYGRLILLQDVDSKSCAEESARLYADLQSGAWRLTSSQWSFYVETARRCFQPDAQAEEIEKQLTAFAEGAGWLWRQWQQIRNGETPGDGRTAVWVGDRPVLLVWRSTPDRLNATIVERAFLAKEWEAALRPIEQEHSSRFLLKDAAGHRVLGAADGSARGSSPQPVITRNVGDAHFPWILETTPANLDTEAARLSVRRALLLAGLALAVLLIAAAFGGYSITRALARELEVARLQSDFVTAVSHEFRTPLASFRQITEMLADSRITDEERRRTYYEALRNESERLGHLVENILDFGRMESGAYEYRFQAVAPDELVQSVAEEFAESIRNKGYHLETTIDNALPRVRGDWEALRLALWNLLDNAVKYSPSSKTIWLETRADKEGVSTHVRDQGVGIPPGEQKDIFKKFVRASSAKAAGIKGAGLGLAMAQQIVAAHGGQIQLASAPGRGSTFTVFLPAIKDHS